MARKYLGESRATKRRVQTLSQALVQTIFQVLSAWFAWRILSTQPWLWHPNDWSIQEDPTVAPDLKFYSLLYAARYISDLDSLRYDVTRRDTWAYAMHHVVSVALVLGSAMEGYIRIGCVMMFLLDWVDPFMLTAKMFRYLSIDRSDGYQVAACRFFEIFGIVSVVTRTIMLNFVVWIALRDFPESAIVLKVLCIVLALLQTFWLVVIVRTALNQFSQNGSVDDIRSDSEDEGDQENKKMARNMGSKKKVH